MLGNANFDTYLSRNLISNCDVVVYENDSGGTILLNKEHIASFTMTRENESAVSFAPNDTAIIEVINWNTLSANTKYWLSQPTSYAFQNFVYIRFQVNGELTNEAIFFAVEKVEVDTKKWRGKITLCSPFKLKTQPFWGSYPLDNLGFDALPNDVTAFEHLQHIAVNTAQGLVIPNYQDYYWNDYDFVTDINRKNIDVVYNKLNILEDIVESEDDNDRSNITFLGIVNKEGDTLYNVTKQPTIIADVPQLNFSFNYGGKSFVITSAKVFITHSGSDVTNLFTINRGSNDISLNCRSSSLSTSVNYQCVIKGYEVELARPSTEHYVKSYAWLEGSAGLLSAQAKTREYYSHKKYIEFNCRLDPRIEPLDNVLIDELGIIKIEKVSMTFNGGFRGSLKGRLIRGMQLLDPVLSNLQYDDNSFSFNIKNDNIEDVILHIYASDGTRHYSFFLGAGDTITITQNNAPNLMQSFEEKAGGSLGDDVYCYFVDDDVRQRWADSDNVIILEAD